MTQPSRLPGRRAGLYLSKDAVERLERIKAKDRERGVNRGTSAIVSRALEIAEDELGRDEQVRPCIDCRAAGARKGEYMLMCGKCDNASDDRKIVRVK